MTLTLVVAVGANGVIGRDGRMPWPPTGDQRQFKELTTGHPLVMGRTTYDSIGRPLPGRTSIVLTRQSGWRAPGHEDEVLVAADLAEAVARAADLDDEAFLIGGAQVYAEALAAGVVDRMVVTEVQASPDGDAWFPAIDPAVWRETSREHHTGAPGYDVVTYVRADGSTAAS